MSGTAIDPQPESSASGSLDAEALGREHRAKVEAAGCPDPASASRKALVRAVEGAVLYGAARIGLDLSLEDAALLGGTIGTLIIYFTPNARR